MSYYDDSTDLDTGMSVPGPFLDWHPADTRDLAIRAGSWSLRETGERAAPFELKKMVFNWPTSRTGWKEDTGGQEGVSPRKQWNQRRQNFEKPPADGDWKKAIQVEVALAPDQRALWEQNQFGAYLSYIDIMRLINATAVAELPKLPLLVWTGQRLVKTRNGSTLVAVFALQHFVSPPPCLEEPQTLEPPATASAPKLAADVWDVSRGVSAPASAVAGKSLRERINEEVPIEVYGNPSEEIPF